MLIAHATRQLRKLRASPPSTATLADARKRTLRGMR